MSADAVAPEPTGLTSSAVPDAPPPLSLTKLESELEQLANLQRRGVLTADEVAACRERALQAYRPGGAAKTAHGGGAALPQAAALPALYQA